MISPRSKLLLKGLVVIFLPTVFQLVFHIVLAVPLYQSEQEVYKVIESKKVVSAATSVVTKLIDCELIAVFYNSNRLPFLQMKFMDEKRKAELASRELIELCKGDSERAKNAAVIKESCSKTLNRLSDMFTEEFEQEIDVKNYVDSDVRIDKVYDFFTLALRNVDDLLDVEKERQASVGKRQRYCDSKIKGIFICGAIPKRALRGGRAFYLTASTTMRLKVVLDNTRRLLRREALAEPVGGDDEISQLDRVFHATASDLARVDRQRKHLVELVRNELSLPLSKVQYSLHNLSHGIIAELTDKAQSRLSMAAHDTDRVIRLIDDLLSIENMQGAAFDLDIKETSTQEIIYASIASVKQLAERNEIKLEMIDSNLKMVADKDRLVQVLINFLSNAIKFSPPQSSIVIRTEALEEDRVRISVTDKGRGIPEEKLGDVFERFKQVDKADQVEKGGTGLGLPISKTIVEQHGGEIGVNSKEGEGSTFWFII